MQNNQREKKKQKSETLRSSFIARKSAVQILSPDSLLCDEVRSNSRGGKVKPRALTASIPCEPSSRCAPSHPGPRCGGLLFSSSHVLVTKQSLTFGRTCRLGNPERRTSGPHSTL